MSFSLGLRPDVKLGFVLVADVVRHLKKISVSDYLHRHLNYYESSYPSFKA